MCKKVERHREELSPRVSSDKSEVIIMVKGGAIS